MAAPNVAPLGIVGRLRASIARIVDSSPSNATGPRMSQYSERYGIVPLRGDVVLADEGSLFTSSMLPAATALELGLSASFSATAAAFIFKNNAPQTGPNPIHAYLRWIHFIATVPPTSGTALNYATVIDNVNRNPTTISDTAATQTAKTMPGYNVNIDDATAPSGQWWFPNSVAAGAPPTVPAAGANVRTLMGNGRLRTQIPVAADDYRIVFNGTDQVSGSALVTAAPAGVSRIVEPHAPVIIGPQEFFLLYLWAPSNITAGLNFFQADVCWAER